MDKCVCDENNGLWYGRLRKWPSMTMYVRFCMLTSDGEFDILVIDRKSITTGRGYS